MIDMRIMWLLLTFGNHRNSLSHLGILCTRPAPKWLKAIVILIILSAVKLSLCPSSITCKHNKYLVTYNPNKTYWKVNLSC